MLWGIADIKPVCQSLCLVWRIFFVERTKCVRVQVVTNKDHDLGVPIVFIKQVFDFLCPVFACLSLADTDLPPPS